MLGAHHNEQDRCGSCSPEALYTVGKTNTKKGRGTNIYLVTLVNKYGKGTGDNETSSYVETLSSQKLRRVDGVAEGK